MHKAGLVELTEDDRATLFGAFLELAAALHGMDDADPDHLRARWRRRGLRAFDADRAAQGHADEAEDARSPLPRPGGDNTSP